MHLRDLAYSIVKYALLIPFDHLLFGGNGILTYQRAGLPASHGHPVANAAAEDVTPDSLAMNEWDPFALEPAQLIAAINPSTGLPMMTNGVIDISGVSFGLVVDDEKCRAYLPDEPHWTSSLLDHSCP